MRRGRGGDLGLRRGRRRLSRAYVIAAPSPSHPPAAEPARRSAALSPSSRPDRTPLATGKAVRLWVGTAEPLERKHGGCEDAELQAVSPHSFWLGSGLSPLQLYEPRADWRT